MPEITPGVYMKTLEWLLDKKTVTVVTMQRELKMGYPLAAKIMDNLKVDGVIYCMQNVAEKRVNHKNIRVVLK